MKLYFLLALLSLSTVAMAQKMNFSDAALKEKLINTDENSITFKEILSAHKGKTIFVKVWASWCKDCLADQPNVERIKMKYKNVAFINLSLDKNVKSWKEGFKKYNVSGEHYFIPKGWKKSAFTKDISLDWIPRYLMIDPKGHIEVFRAIKAQDEKLQTSLERTTI